MATDRRIDHADLEAFARAVLLKAGVSDGAARVEAQITAEVDLCGVHTHGVRMLPGTVEKIDDGRLQAAPRIETVAERPASVLLKTAGGLGRYVSACGMDRAVGMAQEYGIGAVAIGGLGHWGRAYSYALRAARRGFVGLAFTNTIALFPAWGTRAPNLGNNPIAIGVPGAGNDEPAVLDLAMTQSSVSRVRMAAAAGEQVPLGWGLDTDGNPTTDPQAIGDSGRFLPMGGHKGAGLAFMVEMLTSGLAGGLLCFEQGQLGRPGDSDGGSSKLFVAIRPWDNDLGLRLRHLREHIASAPPDESGQGAQWPGQGSFERRLDYLKNGIALPGALAEELEALSEKQGVPLRWKG